MNFLIGRQQEQARLDKIKHSRKSEFVAVYGRRRVGKTFLIRHVFNNDFTFYLTGAANQGTDWQLRQFHAQLNKYSVAESQWQPATDWFTAFQQLIQLLEADSRVGKKVIFFDELPWLDTPKSDFLSSLEHFWNSWASARTDILLIVCGSAASWMIKNLLNNRGGLHNRITARVKLEPFNLAETERFLQRVGGVYDRYQICLFYMVFGGIPFYLEQIDPAQSATQNINELCFAENAPFRSEYENLYYSLFKKAEKHITVVEALATKNKGLTRLEIAKVTGLADGGGLTRVLKELEESSFIRRYNAFGKKKRGSLYQLVDLYSLFYLNFIRPSSVDDDNFWINALESPLFRTWSGYAFEMVCLHHVQQIKRALGISGVQTSVAAWQNEQAQIDLVIDRKDHVINLCEMKFSEAAFEINKSYAERLRNKIAAFRTQTSTKKSLFLTLISTYGVANNRHAGMVQNNLTMDILYELKY